MSTRRIIVGFSGGVTSAWCAGWALRNYPKDEVVLLWHDTGAEHPDTYRFIEEMAAALDMPVTDRSDGRSVVELFYDEGFLGNNQNTMCSQVLKVMQGSRFIRELKAEGVEEIIKVIGYSEKEPERVHRMLGYAMRDGFKARFPVIEEKVTKQQTGEWCQSMGVQPSKMYCWSGHANCVGCVKGGRAYWLAVHRHHPEIFEQFAAM